VTDTGTGGGLPGAPRMAFLSPDPAISHHQLALLELPRDLDASQNVNHIAFEVDSLDDLREVWNRVKVDSRAGGLGFPSPATAFECGQWSIRFSDPEGNGVEVYALTPWEAKAASTPYTKTPGRFFEPFDMDLSDDELAAWGANHMDQMGQEYWPRGKRPWSSV
jgi:Glyoxalase/Bleomycin resistance protein/Dioxygenase superfamily